MSRNDRHTMTVLVLESENGNVSYYGNPSKIFHTSRGTFRTQANSSLAYSCDNDGGFEGHKVELTLTPAGRVTKMRKLKKDTNGGLRDQITDYRHCTQDFM